MRIVRKLSRKRYYGALYEYERFFIPVPAKARDFVRSWVDRDVRVHIQPLSYGFAILVTGPGRIYIDGAASWLKFQRLMREMEPK